MIIEPKKIDHLLSRPFRLADAGELWREENVFFLGEELAAREILETIFDSDNEATVELFVFSFGEPQSFLRAEELVRAVKKNFKGYLLGSFAAAPPAPVIDQAYAAGVDLIDLPLPPAAATAERESLLAAFSHAGVVFPRWSVLSSFAAAEGSLTAAQEHIDFLLDQGVLPFVTLPGGLPPLPSADLVRLYEYLRRRWQRARVALQPLRPLLRLATPLVPPPRTGIGRLLGHLDDARLRTASDLRRLLRVREVRESFDSAGL
jgi:hypothetical protein